MPKVTYIEHNGKEHVIDAPVGQTVMEAAVKHAVPGIDADCGGACACATCHVYVDPEWLAKTGEAGSMEQSMLDFANDVETNSRLSCQIKVSAELDGLVVRPESELERDIHRLKPQIAVITVPAEAAQALVDRVTAAGIKAVLNFAPAPLTVPDGVTLRAVNMATELEILAFTLTNGTTV